MTALFLFVSFASAQSLRELGSRDGANLQTPTWSPDGKKLSYEANYHEKQIVELYQGDPKTGSFMRVMPAVRPGSSTMTTGFGSAAKPGAVVDDLAWSPASVGTRFVFAASNDLQDYDLYLGGGSALAASPGADGGPRWSPDGRWVVFTSARTGQGDLYLLDVLALDKPPQRLSNDATGSELFPTWSSDSTRLVFVGHSDKGDNLWLLPNLTDPPVRLTDWEHSQLRPSYSPDGSRVAFYANREDVGRFDLYVVEPKPGSAPTLLAKDVKPNAIGPSWTPDGTHIVYVSDDDEKLDPVAVVRVSDPSKVAILDLGTVGNGDLDVAMSDGRLQIALIAQGKKVDRERSFAKLAALRAQLPVLDATSRFSLLTTAMSPTQPWTPCGLVATRDVSFRPIGQEHRHAMRAFFGV